MIHKNKYNIKFKVTCIDGRYYAKLINFKHGNLRIRETSYVWSNSDEIKLLKMISEIKDRELCAYHAMRTQFIMEVRADVGNKIMKFRCDFNLWYDLVNGQMPFTVRSWEACDFVEAKAQKVPKEVQQMRVRSSKPKSGIEMYVRGCMGRNGNIKATVK